MGSNGPAAHEVWRGEYTPTFFTHYVIGAVTKSGLKVSLVLGLLLLIWDRLV